jgi:hypothetical protein
MGVRVGVTLIPGPLGRVTPALLTWINLDHIWWVGGGGKGRRRRGGGGQPDVRCVQFRVSCVKGHTQSDRTPI